MKKRFNFTSALTVVLSSALIAMTTLPVLASNTNYDFDFSFDAGNTCVTSTEYKETRHAITMYCTWEEGVSGPSYAVRPRGRSSGIWGGEYNMYEGKSVRWYGTGIYDEGVYMQARLNSNDSDAFSGYWNPDDAQY